MRVCVAEILHDALQQLNLRFPELDDAGMEKLAELKAQLLAEEEA